ncbi:DUF7260 family protein [Haladaptatus salinisoli]|uniref:DUF7260 family protein n=1 Tax=Haladaptatus salinisoli TaxID=2884876 RepID=UPI001D0A1DAD|nr:hypothetical protein [Haladaptatus salinisoli]
MTENLDTLSSARTALAKEQQRLRDEIAAFESFVKRIDDLQPESEHSEHPNLTPAMNITTTSNSTIPLEKIKGIYHDEIFSVEHWKQSYEDTEILESMTEEFGRDIVSALTTQGISWTLFVQGQLRNAGRKSAETRRNTLSLLSEEASQLQSLYKNLAKITEEFAQIEKPENTFDDRTTQLEQLTSRLDTLAYEYQLYLQQRSKSNSIYLKRLIYSELSTTYPGLTTLGVVRSHLDTLQEKHWKGEL